MDSLPPQASTDSLHDYLAQTLPANAEQPHTLVLGANMGKADLPDYLLSGDTPNSTPLSTLRFRHNVTTIGVDYPPYMNVFFWAYQYGTLGQICGGAEKAKSYLANTLRAHVTNDQWHGADKQAELIINAIHKGMHVVAYDAGTHLEEAKKRYGISEDYPNSHSRLELTDDITKDATRYGEWMMKEVEHLLTIKPEYAKRLTPMLQLIDEGRAENLPTDQISAMLFDAAASPKGNRLAICRPSLMDGHGRVAGSSDGLFAHHLASPVSRAFIGNKAATAQFNDDVNGSTQSMGGTRDHTPISLIAVEKSEAKIVGQIMASTPDTAINLRTIGATAMAIRNAMHLPARL